MYYQPFFCDLYYQPFWYSVFCILWANPECIIVWPLCYWVLIALYFGFYLLCLKHCHADCFTTKLPLMSDDDSFDVTDYSGNGVLRNSSSVIRSLESGEIANMQSKLGTRTPQVYTCRKMLLGGQATRQKAWSDTTIITTQSTSWGSPAGNLCQSPLMGAS